MIRGRKWQTHSLAIGSRTSVVEGPKTTRDVDIPTIDVDLAISVCAYERFCQEGEAFMLFKSHDSIGKYLLACL